MYLQEEIYSKKQNTKKVTKDYENIQTMPNLRNEITNNRKPKNHQL